MPFLKDSSSHTVFNESGISVPFCKQQLSTLISAIEMNESCRYSEIEVVFVDENQILEMNRKFLNHDYITDILTFPYNDDPASLDGTLICCASQIEHQARDHNVSFQNELLRIVIHGLLHLAGYDDRTDDDTRKMRKLEDKYLMKYAGVAG